jgi:hypothetical protein
MEGGRGGWIRGHKKEFPGELIIINNQWNNNSVSSVVFILDKWEEWQLSWQRCLLITYRINEKSEEWQLIIMEALSLLVMVVVYLTSLAKIHGTKTESMKVKNLSKLVTFWELSIPYKVPQTIRVSRRRETQSYLENVVFSVSSSKNSITD